MPVGVQCKHVSSLSRECWVKMGYICPALRIKQQHLLAMNPRILHDNARAHTSDAVKDLLCRWRWKMLEHMPYLPSVSRQNERTTVRDTIQHKRGVISHFRTREMLLLLFIQPLYFFAKVSW
jgi:hypothetical protein